MAIFGLLAALTAWGIRRACPHWPTRRALLLALLLSVSYGALDEFHQRFVPTRTADPRDLAADGVGAGLAVAGVAWWRRRRPEAAVP
jgi:VanZ family protein